MKPGRRTWLPLSLLVMLLALAGCGETVPVVPDKPARPKVPVTQTAREQVGVPYRSGGDNPRTGFDCSGLVQWCYGVHGYSLPRRTEDQLRVGRPVEREDLQPGDLLFFNVTRKRWGLHVGVYTGRGLFIHSPTPGAKVREESLYERYWMRTYIGARRILPDQR
ncbi:C40 family peptidase [Fundidesulfovibrio agrisoli]|uniref:C40 family peptidase n=1 Tax=Fundidesulfovibrio agrisoli TaxID=2922717 RepID=UPI001FAD3CC8|nr:C40 family peptidase [Fundidesulfovibrio agrisoli]